jgi:hypothetical protein
MSVQYLPQTRDLPPARIAAMRIDLEAFVTGEEPRTRWWRKRRNVIGGFVVALLVATSGGTAAAYAYLHPRPVTNKGYARCYSELVDVRGSNFPGTTIAQATATGSGSPGLVSDALDTCAALWRVGLLRLGSPSVSPPKGGASYPVPALVGCTLSSGVAAVFPGPPSGCNQLGLAPESPPAVRAATTGPAGSSP